ncbi:MAG: hypothetical protein LC747_02015 [Acidobacteria bacterium]|nr:hypothetical protein [Acidobacteriota bacterium]
MKLPNTDRAVIDLAKLREYSLNPAHPEGKHKARVFRAALGLTIDDVEHLREMLLEAILISEATPRSDTPYGKRFVVDFDVNGFHGSVVVRSAWMIKNGEDFPRLTTCYIL